MRFHYSRVHRFYLAPAVGLVFALAITACSSSGSSSSSTATSAPVATTSAATSSATASAAAGGSATAQITANWEAFFNPATPNSKRVQLLENGAQFAAAINAFSASPLAQSVSSKVDSVSLTSSTKANVKYDLSAAGTSVASGQTGTSVLQNGTWKVGDDVFCGLLKEGASLLNIKIPAACNSAS
jgi:purine-cytosine permease-like protein